MAEELVQRLRRQAEKKLRVPATLHDYQWNGVSFLYKAKSALLADEMGLGKTVQASVALTLLLNTRRDLQRALIVAPAALKLNWVNELSTWAPSLVVRAIVGDALDREALYNLPVQVLVGSYEQIRSDGIFRIPSNCFDIVILDEAQRIKNYNSISSLSCQLLPRKVSWALSATPLENDQQDVTSLLKFLDPTVPLNLPRTAIKSKLKKIMLRRQKVEVLNQLSPVIIQDIKLELSDRQKLCYDKLWSQRNHLNKVLRKDIGSALLGLITRLKIICNADAQSGVSSKVEILNEICGGAGTHARILIFSQFVQTLEFIAKRILVSYNFLTGNMSPTERMNAIEEFNSAPSPRILLASIKAGGVGLNLGSASHVILFDRWWNPAAEVQAIYRAHRFNRTEPLHVFRFIVVDTIEERITSILSTKEANFNDTIDSVKTAAPEFSLLELFHILDIDHNNA